MSAFELAFFDENGCELTAPTYKRIPLPVEVDDNQVIVIGRGPITIRPEGPWPAIHRMLVFLDGVLIHDVEGGVPTRPMGVGDVLTLWAGSRVLTLSGARIKKALEWMA